MVRSVRSSIIDISCMAGNTSFTPLAHGSGQISIKFDSVENFTTNNKIYLSTKTIEVQRNEHETNN